MSDNVMQATNGRFYSVNDTWVPSVTTILSVYPKGEGFDRWLAGHASYDEAIEERDAAGERGTLVHDSIHTLLNGGEVCIHPEEDPRVAKLIQGFVNWYKEAKPQVLDTELFVCTDYYAGTLDLICHIDGEPWLVDIKTSSAVYPSYHLQTAAYASCLPETRWNRGVLLLKTSTKRGWQMVESPFGFHEDLVTFEACLTVYQYEHGLEPIPYEEKPKEPIMFKLEVEE